MATIKDVAKLAGVSHATVSNVLNGYKGVSLDKVQRVQQAVKELSYQLDAKARSLKTNKSMNIGVVLPNVIDPYFSQLFMGIEKRLSESQYAASLYITLEIPAKEKKVLQQIQQQRMDGIIIATCQPQKAELFAAVSQADLKMVFVERDIVNQGYNFVGFDNYASIFEAVNHFLTAGHREIAIIVGPEEYRSEKQCLNGYLDALAQKQIQPNKHLIEITNLNKESAFKAAVRLLQLGEVPDIIVTSSVQLAEGIIKAIEISAYNLTKRPVIASLCEESWTNCSYPEMIKIARPAMLAGEKAAALLLANIENAAFFENEHLILHNFAPTQIEKRVSLVKRESIDSLNVLMLHSSASYSTYSLLADFRQQEGMHVNIDTLNFEELYDEVKHESLHSKYDVFQIDIPWLPEFAENGVLCDLSAYIRQNPAAIEDLIPGILDEYAKYNEKFYGMPFMYGTQLLFYRKDLFEEMKFQRLFFEQYHTELKPPKTWTEYNAVAKFFTRAYHPDSPTQFGTTLGGKFSSGSLCEFLPRQWAYGGMAFDASGNVVLNSIETVKALKNYCDSYQYASPTSSEHWWDEQVNEFCRGQAAMMVLFMSHATDITDRYKSNIVGKVGFDIVPGGTPLLGGWSLGINANSRKKKQAFQFISWACRKGLAIPATILGGSTPCVSYYQSSELVSIYPWLPKAYESFGISRKRLMPKVGGRVLSEKKYEEIIGEAVYQAITRQLAPEAAIELAAGKLRQLIQPV